MAVTKGGIGVTDILDEHSFLTRHLHDDSFLASTKLSMGFSGRTTPTEQIMSFVARSLACLNVKRD